jgi:hypothetical protein
VKNSSHQHKMGVKQSNPVTIQAAYTIVPVNFGLKYTPPKIGLQYHLKD